MNRQNDIRSTEHFFVETSDCNDRIFFDEICWYSMPNDWYTVLLQNIRPPPQNIKITRFDTLNLMLERRNNKQYHRLVHLNVKLLYSEVCWITLKHHSTTVMFFKAHRATSSENLHLMPSNLGANLLFKHAPSDLVCVKLMSLCPISSSS